MMKHILLIILLLSFTSCKAQDIINDSFYAKSHSLLKSKFLDTKVEVRVLKKFDFNNNRNLGESDLYNKMVDWHKVWFINLDSIEITRNDIKNLYDEKGWKTNTSKNSNEDWDSKLLEDSSIVLVDTLVNPGFVKRLTYINIKSLQFSFKENLALMEYDGMMGKELHAFKWYNGKWCFFAIGTEYEEPDE